jgi:hypothetical protein
MNCYHCGHPTLEHHNPVWANGSICQHAGCDCVVDRF